MRTLHQEPAIHVFDLTHDHDRRARNGDPDGRNLTLRPIIKQDIIDLVYLQMHTPTAYKFQVSGYFWFFGNRVLITRQPERLWLIRPSAPLPCGRPDRGVVRINPAIQPRIMM